MYTGSFCSSNHPHLALAFLNSCHHFNQVQKHLTVVLIYISLMANYIDPSLPTDLPSDYQFWCCVCSSFLLIFNWVIFFFLPLSLENPLYIQDTNYLVYEQFAHFFSFVGHAFHVHLRTFSLIPGNKVPAQFLLKML